MSLFLHCRPGFEKECAAEITDLAAQQGLYGYCKTQPHSAYVEYITESLDNSLACVDTLPFHSLMFARQWCASLPQLTEMPSDDRISSLLAAARQFPKCADVWVETADTNDGKALSGLCKKIVKPLLQALKKTGQLKKSSPYRLHVIFTSGQSAYVGCVKTDNSAAWSMGIPRLRVPRTAPSRATLKLEEAWHHFIPRHEWDERLAGSMTGIDLGAAPGGWTWQLVNRGMFVEAVDNGPMQEALMDSGQVTHHRADGFLFEPKGPVDWLVCDIVDKPSRTTDMIAHWMEQGWFSEAVFNLKLPMKQRYSAVLEARHRLLARAKAAGLSIELAVKQLYHDREEVTVHVRIL